MYRDSCDLVSLFFVLRFCFDFSTNPDSSCLFLQNMPTIVTSLLGTRVLAKKKKKTHGGVIALTYSGFRAQLEESYAIRESSQV